MLKSCADCPVCHCKGKDDPWNYYCVATMDDINIEEWDKERYITCPLKSIDGLIEKMEQLHTQENAEGQDMFQAYDVLRTIKEYCGVKK